MRSPTVKRWLLPETCWSRRPIQHLGALVHFISASRDHPDDPFSIQHIRDILSSAPASAHDFIDRDGVVWELVPQEYRAWHAGASAFRGLAGLNDYFLGIELAGTVNSDFTPRQYDALAWRLRYYMSVYRFPTSHIKGHEDVSDHTVRPDPKVDPGPYFDWVRLGMLIAR